MSREGARRPTVTAGRSVAVRWLRAAFGVAAVAATPGCGAPLLTDLPTPQQGSFDAAIEHDGRERTFRAHPPPGGSAAGRRPLLVVLHGGGSSGAGMEEVTGFSRIADREGLYVVYPDGIGGPHGLGRAWNAGGCCGPPAWFGVDDAGYVESLVDALEQRWPIDPGRRFLVGYSNGGMLAYRMATTSRHRFAGLAVYAATMTGWGPLIAPEFDDPLPDHPTTVIAIHSYADPWVEYQGEEHVDGIDVSFLHVGQFWAVAAGCPRRAVRRRAFGGSALVHHHRRCEGGTEVKQITLYHWDHEWPGPANLADQGGHPLSSFDAAEEIWKVLARAPAAAGASERSARSWPAAAPPP